MENILKKIENFLNEGTYIVSFDFKKYQPKWTEEYIKNFGKKNEGVKVKAKNEKDAIEQFHKLIKKEYNPFYLKVVKE